MLSFVSGGNGKPAVAGNSFLQRGHSAYRLPSSTIGESDRRIERDLARGRFAGSDYAFRALGSPPPSGKGLNKEDCHAFFSWLRGNICNDGGGLLGWYVKSLITPPHLTMSPELVGLCFTVEIIHYGRMSYRSSRSTAFCSGQPRGIAGVKCSDPTTPSGNISLPRKAPRKSRRIHGIGSRSQPIPCPLLGRSYVPVYHHHRRI